MFARKKLRFCLKRDQNEDGVPGAFGLEPPKFKNSRELFLPRYSEPKNWSATQDNLIDQAAVERDDTCSDADQLNVTVHDYR